MQCGDLRRGQVQSLAPADSGGHLLSPAPARGGGHFGHVLQQSLKGSLTVVTGGTVTCTRCRHLRSLAPTSSGGYLLQSLPATRTCGGVTCGHLLQRAVAVACWSHLRPTCGGVTSGHLLHAAHLRWGHVRSLAPAGSRGYLLDLLAAHLRWGHVRSLAPAGSGGYLLESLAAHLRWGHVRSLAPAGSGGYLLVSLAAHLRWGHVRSLAPAGSGGYLLESLAAHLRWGHVLSLAPAGSGGYLLDSLAAHLRWGHVRSLAPAGSGGCLLESLAATCGALAVGSRAVTCSSGQWRLLAGLMQRICGGVTSGHLLQRAKAVACGRLQH